MRRLFVGRAAPGRAILGPRLWRVSAEFQQKAAVARLRNGAADTLMPGSEDEARGRSTATWSGRDCAARIARVATHPLRLVGAILPTP